MTTKRMIAEFLIENKEEYISGQRIADYLKISRSAVWKAISSLQNDGYRIDAIKNKGYKLSGFEDSLSAERISLYLENSDFFDIKVFDKVDSTNTLLSKCAFEGEKTNAVYAAKMQSAGKGRLGRRFVSPDNSGIYFSILLRPQILPERAVFLTTIAAVAVCKAIENVFSLSPKIKWVNDIFIDNKKVCGILTQASLNFESQSINHVVVGIGLNVYEPMCGFDGEIKNIAGAVLKAPAEDAKNRILAAILDEFKVLYDDIENRKAIMEDYRKRCFVIGKSITVFNENEQYNAKAESIDNDCALIVKKENGEIERLFSGEISIRL